MVDKDFCASSYLVFRYIIDDEKDFVPNIKHRSYKLIPESERILVRDEYDIDCEVKKQFDRLIFSGKKLGILLSGGMDSACLASYMDGMDAYTFRFLEGNSQKDELERAESYANRFHLTLHYVDIDWSTVKNNIDTVICSKGAPVHSIEPQIYQAAMQAKSDGIDTMLIGDAADYVFGGMDGLHKKDWMYEEFKRRYTYLSPEEVLINPVDLDYAFAKYKRGEHIDFIGLMHEYTDIESYASYDNAFVAANMDYLDPYEILKMAEPLDLERIRNGESKYLIRALFRLKYPEMDVPNKLPMPRPVDAYFDKWEGPTRKEFKKNIDLSKFNGNQKWLLWCLEYYLNYADS